MARGSNRVGPGKHKHRRRLYLLLGLSVTFCALGLLGYARRVQVSSCSAPSSLAACHGGVAVKLVACHEARACREATTTVAAKSSSSKPTSAKQMPMSGRGSRRCSLQAMRRRSSQQLAQPPVACQLTCRRVCSAAKR